MLVGLGEIYYWMTQGFFFSGLMGNAVAAAPPAAPPAAAACGNLLATSLAIKASSRSSENKEKTLK